jgi:hypothetical protein
MAQLVHHFSDARNLALIAKIARALRPGAPYQKFILSFAPAQRGGPNTWMVYLP